jgi:hypothetical protein
VVVLRQEWRTIRQIATPVGASPSTAARICRSVELSRLRTSERPAVPVRYEWKRPGELLHVDIKRVGRFDRVGHRITRQRSFGSPRQGFEFVYVATDDHSRLSYVEILADGRSEAASSLLKRAAARFALQDVRVERVMTDNGSAFVLREFTNLCRAMSTVTCASGRTLQERTAKAERFIKTLLREGAYHVACQTSDKRRRLAHTLPSLLQRSPRTLFARLQSAHQPPGSEQRPYTRQLGRSLFL